MASRKLSLFRVIILTGRSFHKVWTIVLVSYLRHLYKQRQMLYLLLFLSLMSPGQHSVGKGLLLNVVSGQMKVQSPSNIKTCANVA